MYMEKERTEIVEYLKKLITHGLTKGTGGNISIYDPEKGRMAISPSGLDYFALTPEDIVVMDLDGNRIQGRLNPSSEYDMHRIFYKNRDDIRSVVHAHSPFACVLASLNWDLEPTTYLVAHGGRDVRCTKYETYGSPELAKSALLGMKDRNAVLLGNHGLLAGGCDLATAFNRAEEIEFCCEIYYRAKCAGEPVILPVDEMDRVIEKFKTYGAQPSEGE